MLRKIVMEVIPHAKQRYDTIGDYWEDEDGTLHIVTSDLGDDIFNAAVLKHEFEEYLLCRERGILEPDIMAFDLAVPDDSPYADDPGMDPTAPYHCEHIFATAGEMLFIGQAKKNWDRYCKRMATLPQWMPHDE